MIPDSTRTESTSATDDPSTSMIQRHEQHQIEQYSENEQSNCVRLSELLDLVVTKIYHEIYVMMDLLEHRDSTERRRYTIELAATCYNLLYRLFGVVKWTRDSGLVSHSENVIQYMHDQIVALKETADSLYYMYNEEIPGSILGELDVSFAYKHLNTHLIPTPIFINRESLSVLAPKLYESENFRRFPLDKLNAYYQFIFYRSWNAKPLGQLQSIIPSPQSLHIRTACVNSKLVLDCENFYQVSLILDLESPMISPLKIIDIKLDVSNRGFRSHHKPKHWIFEENRFGDSTLTPNQTLSLIAKHQFALERFQGSIYLLHLELKSLSLNLHFMFMQKEFREFIYSEKVADEHFSVVRQDNPSVFRIEYWAHKCSIEFRYEVWSTGPRIAIEHKPTLNECRTASIYGVFENMNKATLKKALDLAIYYRTADELSKLYMVLKRAGLSSKLVLDTRASGVVVNVIRNDEKNAHFLSINNFTGVFSVRENSNLNDSSEELRSIYMAIIKSSSTDRKTIDQHITQLRLRFAHNAIQTALQSLSYQTRTLNKRSLLIEGSSSVAFDPFAVRAFSHNQSLILVALPAQTSSQIRFGYASEAIEGKNPSSVIWLNNDTIVRSAFAFTIPSVSDYVENPTKFAETIANTIMHLRQIIPLLLVCRSNSCFANVPFRIAFDHKHGGYFLNMPAKESSPYDKDEIDGFNISFANATIGACRIFFLVDRRFPGWRMEFDCVLGEDHALKKEVGDNVRRTENGVMLSIEYDFRNNENPFEYWISSRQMTVKTLFYLHAFHDADQDTSPFFVESLSVGRFAVRYNSNIMIYFSCINRSPDIRLCSIDASLMPVLTFLSPVVSKSVLGLAPSERIINRLEAILKMSRLLALMDGESTAFVSVSSVVNPDVVQNLSHVPLWSIRLLDTNEAIELCFSIWVRFTFSFEVDGTLRMETTRLSINNECWNDFNRMIGPYVSDFPSEEVLRMTIEQFEVLCRPEEPYSLFTRMLSSLVTMHEIQAFLFVSHSIQRCDGITTRSTKTLLSFSFDYAPNFEISFRVQASHTDENISRMYGQYFTMLETFFHDRIGIRFLCGSALTSFLRLIVETDSAFVFDLLRLEDLSEAHGRLGLQIQIILESTSACGTPRIGYTGIWVQGETVYFTLRVLDLLRQKPSFTALFTYTTTSGIVGITTVQAEQMQVYDANLIDTITSILANIQNMQRNGLYRTIVEFLGRMRAINSL